jgi:sRNA-binding carbon storage regulator CsrA
MVNDQIEVKVLRIKGKQVHIGIDAPSSTLVHRKEVWARINGITLPVEPEHTNGTATSDVDDETRAGA